MKRLILFIFLASALYARGQGFSDVQVFLPDIVRLSTSYTGGTASITKMAFDRTNNKYILGSFDGIMDLDAGPNTRSDTSVGNGNVFVVKEDAAGNFIWARRFDGLPVTRGFFLATEIEVDALGNSYIAGSVSDSFDLDPGPGVYRLSTGTSRVAFIIKLDASGNFVWAKSHEPSALISLSFNTGLKVTGNAIYATATFAGTVDVDPGPGIFNAAAIAGATGMLLTRLDTAGNFVWGKPMSGKGLSSINSLAADSDANLYIAGGFQDTVDFDPGPGTHFLTATPWAPGFPFGYNTDIFVAKYDAAGNLAWAHGIGGHYNDVAKSLAVDRFANVLVSGLYAPLSWDEVDFDPGPGTYKLSEHGGGFILKLRSDGDFAWARNASGGPIATDDSGSVFFAYTLQKLDSSGKTIWNVRTDWHGNAPTLTWIGVDRKDSIYVTGFFSGTFVDLDPSIGIVYRSCLPFATQSGYVLKLNQIPNPFIGAAVNETSLKPAVDVYPNPSSGVVVFASLSTIHRVEIADMAGRIVHASEPSQAKTVINLSNSAAGVYFYDVDCGARKQRGKIVIY